MPEALIDKYGRFHDYLRISLTEKCNLRCTYCMPEEGVNLTPKSELMTTEEIFALAEIFVGLGVRKIRLTGGEPLVRKDAGKIIRSLSSLGIHLSLTTNGLLTDRFIDDFKAAGLRDINISLDTLREDRFDLIARRTGFKKVLESIDLLLSEKVRLKLNVVLMKGMNEDEIIDFVEFTRDKEIKVRFIEFMPFDGNNWQWNKIVSHESILDKINAHYKLIKLQDSPHDTTRAYQVEGFKGSFGLISSMTNHFCSTCNRIRLTADGKLRNCLFSNEETDLLRPYRQGKNIIPLIQNTVIKKYPKHAGIEALDKLDQEDPEFTRRSMILIGG